MKIFSSIYRKRKGSPKSRNQLLTRKWITFTVTPWSFQVYCLKTSLDLLGSKQGLKTFDTKHVYPVPDTLWTIFCKSRHHVDIAPRKTWLVVRTIPRNDLMFLEVTSGSDKETLLICSEQNALQSISNHAFKRLLVSAIGYWKRIFKTISTLRKP